MTGVVAWWMLVFAWPGQMPAAHWYHTYGQCARQARARGLPAEACRVEVFPADLVAWRGQR